MRIIPPEFQNEEMQILERARQGERIEHYETERLAKDGRRVNISLTVSLARDRAGNVVGVARVGRDITERKQAERVRDLLMGELNHRVKNTLATVQAIATQTLLRADSPVEFADSFGGRLRALAHAHTLLTDNSWQGTSLLTLVRDQLFLGGEEDDRISYSGPSVDLDPQASLHLALVLHELGTNARKYGALSAPKGRLSIHWTVNSGSGRCLNFFWKEWDGPPVSAPSRRGFGTTLIEQSLRAHGGEVVVAFEAKGVSCEIRLPLREGLSTRGAYSVPQPFSLNRTSKDGSHAASLRNRRILVVEDEALVAMDVASILENEGCEVVGPAATINNAKSLIGERNFDVALLDANLGGDATDELAAMLTRFGIPFAFVTGYGRDGLPEAFRQAPLIRKPYARNQLLDVLVQLLSRGATVVPIRQNNC